MMTFAIGVAPRRKHKNVANALDGHEDYQKLRAVILNGSLQRGQTAFITLGPVDAEQLQLKWPWRAAADGLRRLARQGYELSKYETDAPGVWCVRVRRAPTA